MIDSPITHKLQSGELSMTLTHGAERLGELLAFASRLNPRRGYLHVSRVLGKHIPVRPGKMAAIHRELAELVTLAGETPYVLGMAETAVGLGAGVARNLAQLHGRALFQHTTRFHVESPWIRVREAHSHADTMHLARPDKGLMDDLAQASDLVLVDDEISTGATLAGLIRSLLDEPLLANVQRVHVISIVSWLDSTKQAAFMETVQGDIDVRFINLMEGSFEFEPDPAWTCSLPEGVEKDFSPALQMAEHETPVERDGLYARMMMAGDELVPSSIELPGFPLDQPIAVVGMGEYLDTPFRVALALEQLGHDVVFQSSTRSPIALGGCIEARAIHMAPCRPDLQHFLYNPCPQRQNLIFDGVHQLSTVHQLQESIAALRIKEALA